ncbi:hypothetical protein M3202_13885 [Alkalihalobacillus oceani]|uniref:Uncharacterized protein n=1 Tax=Halalkalibacter oceani TaxID=1653776 RepID=A0A9X2IPF3_9BACI|nr:hypothetical protein [Halalkalibacter oceani]MCM3715175.1 hypothetical protein [Halalkalibacter oceani]
MEQSLFKGEAGAFAAIEQDIIHTYKLITSSRYITNRHLEQISADAKKRLSHVESEDDWLYLLTYMRGIYTLAERAATYEEYERRFHYFFQAMSDELLAGREKMQLTGAFRPFLEQLLFLVVYHAEEAEAPWPPLLFQLLKNMEASYIEPIFTFLSESVDRSRCSRPLSLAYSYAALLAGDEKAALSILRAQRHPYLDQELRSHFELLKQRSKWQTMKEWVDALFPHKHQGTFGSLQPFIDEMKTTLPANKKEFDAVWNRWLLSPSYQRFLTFSKHYRDDELEELLNRLLPELKRRLHQVEAAKTFEKLLLTTKRYPLAADYFLKHERDPLRMRPEKVELLEALRRDAPAYAKPVYHQLVIRLIEKKSRLHYEQAAVLLKELKGIYEQDETLFRFADYLTKLKKMYRTYRAFIEELKRIGL